MLSKLRCKTLRLYPVRTLGMKPLKDSADECFN
jgi:hypothetical protein